MRKCEAVVECVEDAVRSRILARAVGQGEDMIRVEPVAEVQGNVQVARVAEDHEPVGEVHGEPDYGGELGIELHRGGRGRDSIGGVSRWCRCRGNCHP